MVETTIIVPRIRRSVRSSPQIIATPNPSFETGISSTYDMTQDVVSQLGTSSYALSGVLASGLLFNNATGTLIYDGAGLIASGPHQLTVVDAVGSAQSASFNITAQSTNFTVGDVVFVDGTGNQSHDLAQYYSSSIPAGESVTGITLISGVLPAGISINETNEALDFDDAVGGVSSASGISIEVTTLLDDWQFRSTASGVFYINNFSYVDRAAYLAGAYSYQNDSITGKNKLDLETTIKLSGSGASRHNWFASEGANESGPAWNFSFDGLGAQTVNTKKTEFYYQYSMYVDQGWVDFTYGDGAIKTHIIFNPGVPPFAHGEIVHTRRGDGPWPSGFRVGSGATNAWQIVWTVGTTVPTGLNGDDTYYTFWDGGPQSEGGETDFTDINLFERRWGPRRKNEDRTDPDYANIPQLEGGKWYTFETYVNVSGANSVVKTWWAERGQAPVLMYGLMDALINENVDTYRGCHLINRAENTTVWVPSDTFIVFDELIVSDNEIVFPGGFTLPSSGITTPSGWPPVGAAPRV